MKKTFVTTMPDHIGAFLKASECFAELGVNITRVSYNKAVDSHTLFIDAEGSPEQLDEAGRRLTKIGYLQNQRKDPSIVLLEFRLRDVAGSVAEVLRIISRFNFNISYISSQENGTDHQFFKMGLFVEDDKKLEEFIKEAERLCRVRVIDYNRSEKIYDNSIFYNSFVNGIAGRIGLSDEGRSDLLVYANLAMQMLDEQGLSPYKTFDSISRLAELLAKSRGEGFSPRIKSHRITENTEITVIEPPCGSNTMIIKSFGEYLFVDSGYAIYRREMQGILRELIPGFDGMKKRIFVTHADLDHCGLLPIFDEILASKKTAECLFLEDRDGRGFRERNSLHEPYVKMCKLLTEYAPPDPERVTALWERSGSDEPLERVGSFDFGELHFEVYEGLGGHIPGETVLIDHEHRIAVTGDIYINIRGMTAEQAEYNRYAPILMTSVDTDPALCRTEREALLGLLTDGEWQIFGSHGEKKDYCAKG